MKTQPAVIVYLSGGVAQGARATLPVSVEVFDVDNLKEEGFSDDVIEAMWKAKEKEFPVVCF